MGKRYESGIQKEGYLKKASPPTNQREYNKKNEIILYMELTNYKSGKKKKTCKNLGETRYHDTPRSEYEKNNQAAL